MKNIKLMLALVVALMIATPSYSHHQHQLTQVGVVVSVVPHYQTLIKTDMVYDCAGVDATKDCQGWSDREARYKDGYTVTFELLGEEFSQVTSKTYEVGDHFPVVLLVMPN